jgi:hypothetical protein
VHRAKNEAPRAGQPGPAGRPRGGGSTPAAQPQGEAVRPPARTSPMIRSRSYHEPQRPRELSLGRALPQGLLSEATAGTTHVAAHGSLIGTNDELITPATDGIMVNRDAEKLEPSSLTTPGFLRRGLDGDLPSRPSSSSLLGDLREPEATALPSRPSAASLLDSRFTPTQPSKSAVVPLGRSKSQLTLLLERENARIGDKPRTKN